MLAPYLGPSITMSWTWLLLQPCPHCIVVVVVVMAVEDKGWQVTDGVLNEPSGLLSPHHTVASSSSSSQPCPHCDHEHGCRGHRVVSNGCYIE